MIKVLVVDSESVFQNLLCRLLASHGMQVVGRASSCEQAALIYRATWPDVVLIDVSSENTDKLAAIKTIKEMDELAKLVVFSIFNSVEDIASGNGDLIDAYVVKGSSAKEIVKTIEEVAISKH